MPNETSQVVSSLSGKEKSPVPATEAAPASNARMAAIMKSVQRKSGAVVPNSEERDKTPEGEKKSNGEAKRDEKPTETSSKEGATPSKESTPPPAKEEKPPKIDWEGESKKHQSRADKAEARIKELDPIIEKANATIEELSRYKKQVDEFTADAPGYIMKHMPSLGKQLASFGDPVKMVEAEALEYQKQLDEQFFKEFGEDWRYNEMESMRPGTPSFRYRLAMNDKIDEARTRYRNFMDNQRREAEIRQKSIDDDKRKLKEEFGLTDEDFVAADKLVSEGKVGYYNLAKMALIDKIIEMKVKSITPAPSTPPNLEETKGADSRVPEKSTISDGGKAILSRFGRAALKR